MKTTGGVPPLRAPEPRVAEEAEATLPGELAPPAAALAADAAGGARAVEPPRILDPAAVPVSGTDAHLPAVAAAALTPSALRARFAQLSANPWQPEFVGDGIVRGGRTAANASVLIALVQRPQGLHVLLTRRTDHLRDHAGQISFPGGRAEASDTGPADTALREAEEEVGLQRSLVDVIGQMPTYRTITGFIVTPVVALVQPPLALVLHAGEVAEAFEVPLPFLMNPAHHQRHVFAFDGGQRQFLSMPWQGAAADSTPRRYFIWGATAAMLRNLYGLLA